MSIRKWRGELVPLIATVCFLVAGGVAALAGRGDTARWIWLAGTALMGAPLVVRTLGGIVQGHLAADIVASLSILGALALDQPLAGLVIVLMQSGGEALERYAEGRASAAVQALEAAAPRFAHRLHGTVVEEVRATDVVVDDILLVRPGEMIACDGVVLDGESELDTSSLTGEAAPVRAHQGSTVMSGSINGLGSFRLRVTAPAERSQYARIVELVRSAQASKAPLQRLADRYAVWFTPITVAVCAIAVGVTHDWMRALAILVVATPCPLILATPVAIIGGINQAAKRFVIIRHGGALEQLAAVDVAVFDKTGTITIGRPSLHAARTTSDTPEGQLLRYAAAVERHSSHQLARVLVAAVEARQLGVPPSDRLRETAGLGISGEVDGHRVVVGARAFVLPQCASGERAAQRVERPDGTLRAYVAIDGRLAGVLEFADELRPELRSVLEELEALGVRRTIVLSGDHDPVVQTLARRAGIAEAHGDLLPEGKSRFIDRLRDAGRRVAMVGDGINDAPALSSANVGVALAAHGGGITAEAADVVVLVDSLRAVVDAIAIGRRTLRIARQSIIAGLGLSAMAMLVAAFGHVPPIRGAALQEVIDVAVILNALRASRSQKRVAGTSSSRLLAIGAPHAAHTP